MRLADGRLAFTATDLSRHVACRHLTTLRRGVALGEIGAPPPYDDPPRRRAEAARHRTRAASPGAVRGGGALGGGRHRGRRAVLPPGPGSCAERRRADDHLSLVAGSTRGHRARLVERGDDDGGAGGDRLAGRSPIGRRRRRRAGAHPRPGAGAGPGAARRPPHLRARHAGRAGQGTRGAARAVGGRHLLRPRRGSVRGASTSTAVRQGVRASVESYSISCRTHRRGGHASGTGRTETHFPLDSFFEAGGFRSGTPTGMLLTRA